MNSRFFINCVLTLDNDPGLTVPQWCSWCPELDVVSCGYTPDEAAAMLEDAIRIVVADDISNGNWKDGVWIPKRVHHPLRRGSKDHYPLRTADYDDDWKSFQQYKERRAEWEFVESLSLTELADGLDTKMFLSGEVRWNTRSGVVAVWTSIDSYADVPATKFEAEVQRKQPTKRTAILIRTSVAQTLDRDGLYAVANKRLYSEYDIVVSVSGPLQRHRPIVSE